MEGMEPAIEETLRQPKSVVQSPSEDEARLYCDFSTLAHEDILACLAFAAERGRRVMAPPAA